MQNAILTALLLDPFLTFAEAEKEFGAMPAASPKRAADSLKPQAPVSPARSARRPVPTRPRGVPVVHHLPAGG